MNDEILDKGCTLWKSFLNDCFPGDEEISKKKIAILQEFMGYCLMDTLSYEKFLVLAGAGETGKIVITNVISDMLRLRFRDDAIHIFPSSGSLTNPFHVAYMEDRRLVIIDDEIGLTDIKHRTSAAIKKMVSGEIITVEKKHGPIVQFKPVFKIIFSVNNLPDPGEMMVGLIRRMLLIKIEKTVSPDKRNQNLSDMIIENELKAILSWAEEGMNRLKEVGKFTDMAPLAINK